MNVLKCPLCESLSLSFKLYVSHLRLVHSKDSSFNILCGVDGCREVFRAFSAFNSHVYRHHPSVVGVGATEPQELTLLTCGSSNQAPGPSFQEECTSDMLGLESVTIDSAQDEDKDCSTCSAVQIADPCELAHLKTVTAAKFLLQLREGRPVSQVAISDVLAGCKSLCKQAADEIKEGVGTTLASAGISCESIPGLTDVLDNDPDPFQSIDSNYLFEKFCIEHLGCLVC